MQIRSVDAEEVEEFEDYEEPQDLYFFGLPEEPISQACFEY
jgi:hypothetical protein